MIVSAVVVALLIDPQLEEMGGVLNLALPLGMAMMVLVVWIGRMGWK